MFITLHAKGNIADREQIFLKGSYDLMQAFMQVCDLLKSDLEAAYQTSESRDMGLSLEQDVLLQMEELLQSLDIGSLEGIVLHGYFGSGLCTKKYINALTALAGYQKVILKKANAIFAATADDSPLTISELRLLGKRIAFALGDLIYSLSHIIYDPVDARYVLENPEETFTYSSELQYFFHTISRSPEEFARYLAELQHTYISVIPIYEDNPEAWEQITSQLDPSLVDTLTDYGVYITDLDVRAVKKKLLSIDENYLDTLSARAESDSYIANENPEYWAAFIKLIPDKYISTFIDIDWQLTPGLLEPALQSGEIRDDYVSWLLNFLKGETNGETKYFDKT